MIVYGGKWSWLNLKWGTEENPAVTIATYIHEELRSNLVKDTGYLRGFPQPLQANSRRLPQLGDECFLSNPFQFILSLGAVQTAVLKASYNRPIKQEVLGATVHLLSFHSTTRILSMRDTRIHRKHRRPVISLDSFTKDVHYLFRPSLQFNLS
jgi:hypothetical protein